MWDSSGFINKCTAISKAALFKIKADRLDIKKPH